MNLKKKSEFSLSGRSRTKFSQKWSELRRPNPILLPPPFRLMHPFPSKTSSPYATQRNLIYTKILEKMAKEIHRRNRKTKNLFTNFFPKSVALSPHQMANSLILLFLGPTPCSRGRRTSCSRTLFPNLSPVF